MDYQMGSHVLVNGANMYTVYYGNWTLSQQEIVNDFVSNLGGSSWYSYMSDYYYQADLNSERRYVDRKLKLSKWVNDSYSLGETLQPTDYSDIISNLINDNVFPKDPKGIYAVLPSADVQCQFYINGTVETFGERYCGFHRFDNVPILFAKLTPAESNCSFKLNMIESPNGDVLVDNMLSHLAHEIVETVLSPEDNRAWIDDKNLEPADICNSDLGNVSASSPHYNVEIGSRKYLIQNMYNLKKHQCMQGSLSFKAASSSYLPSQNHAPSLLKHLAFLFSLFSILLI